MGSLFSQTSPSGENERNETRVQTWLKEWSPNGREVAKPIKTTASTFEDDSDGHLSYDVGDVLVERFEILSDLGRGTFGKVTEVLDAKTNTIVALKIIKRSRRSTGLFSSEVSCLSTIKKRDPKGKHHCILMLESFIYKDHTLISFPIYGESVYNFLKSNNFYPYPMNQIKHISQQLTDGVQFLHGLGLIHTDLKPENVLFVSKNWTYICNNGRSKHVRRMNDTRIKIIDFGSATFSWEYHSKLISTRDYRAPEVIMQIGWSYPCDIWSLGCIFFELYNGFSLFPINDDLPHLAMMERVIGERIPPNLIKKSRVPYFEKGRLCWDYEGSWASEINTNCKAMSEYVGTRDESVSRMEVLFLDMITKILVFDQRKRIDAKRLLLHPFFTVDV